MSDNLLACKERVVADVVDRHDRSTRNPASTQKPQFPCRSPRLGLDPLGWNAEQRLLGRIEQPRVVAIEGHAQVLGLGGIDRTTNRLRTVMKNVNADDFTTGAPDRLQEARFIHGEKLALG